MANLHKGEVSVVIGETTYTLALTLNAMVEIETHFGKTWQEIATAAEGGSLPHVLRLLYACTRKHHKDLTIEAFGDMDLADVPTMTAAVLRVLVASMPDARDKSELEGGKKRPRTAQAKPNGTGVGSNSTRVGSA